MRVLHFAHSYIPQYGGTTTRLINLLSDPANQHTICVPFPRLAPGKSVPAVETIGNVTVRRVRLKSGPSIGPFAARNACLMADAIPDSEVYDVVQGHNPPPFARAGYRVARSRDLPCIYEAHRLSFDSFGANRETPLPRVVDRWIRWVIRREERPFFENADAVIVQTTMHERRIRECFDLVNKPIYVIPMGVDEATFDPAIAKDAAAEIRRINGWDDRVVFYYNGYLGSSNGIMNLLNAAKSLEPGVRKKIRIAIQGRGPLEEAVHRATAAEPDLIQFLDSAPYEQMPAYYLAADVVVIPVAPIRLWDCNNPTKLLEAMAMERPVLASDVRGVTELMLNGVSGVTFEAGDEGALASEISSMASNIDSFATIGKVARETIIKVRTWRRCRDLLQNLYDTLR